MLYLSQLVDSRQNKRKNITRETPCWPTPLVLDRPMFLDLKCRRSCPKQPRRYLSNKYYPHHCAACLFARGFVSRGELFDYIVRHQRLQEGQACFFFRQLVRVQTTHPRTHKSCAVDPPQAQFLFDSQPTPRQIRGISNSGAGFPPPAACWTVRRGQQRSPRRRPCSIPLSSSKSSALAARVDLLPP